MDERERALRNRELWRLKGRASSLESMGAFLMAYGQGFCLGQVVGHVARWSMGWLVLLVVGFALQVAGARYRVRHDHLVRKRAVPAELSPPHDSGCQVLCLHGIVRTWVDATSTRSTRDSAGCAASTGRPK